MKRQLAAILIVIGIATGAGAQEEQHRFAPEHLSATSFDCSRSYGLITNTICNIPALAALDRRLASSFSQLDHKLGEHQNRILHFGETAFLNTRQNCLSIMCLQRIYLQRIEELKVAKTY